MPPPGNKHYLNHFCSFAKMFHCLFLVEKMYAFVLVYSVYLKWYSNSDRSFKYETVILIPGLAQAA